MQSIRIWLAGVVRNNAAIMRRGMAIWLQADATLDDFRALGANETRRFCHTVLEELRGWLEDDLSERVARARAALGGQRACLLARSYVVEFLKQETHLGTRSRPEERAVIGLLDAFFADKTESAGGLAPTLPSASHANRQEP